jgi:hypothetical protein
MGVIRPPLRVAESDGSPSVRPVNVIAFNSADFVVVDQGGATVRIDAHPGAGASLTDTYIGFGDSSNLLTGSANFTFVDETGGAGPTVLLTGDKPTIKIQDDTDATDYRTELQQSGASLFTFAKNTAGGSVEMLRMDATYFAYQRGGSPNVGIGTIPDSNVALHLLDDGTDVILRLESSDAGASVAPILDLFRNSASPDTGDDLGQILFSGNDSAGAKQNYFQIKGEIRDKTSGSDDGELIFIGPSNSTDIEFVRMSKTVGVVVNEGGGGIVDFRVEGTANDNLIRTDAGQDNVGIGTAPDSDVERLHVKGTGTGTLVRLESSDTGASSAPILELFRNSASPANGDDLGRILWSAEKADGSKYSVTKLYTEINTVDNSDRMMFNVASSGGSGHNDYEYLRFDGGVRDIIFNEGGVDIDLRMEGDSVTQLFFLDASQDNIGIGGLPDSGVERLHIQGTGVSSTGLSPTMKIETTEDGATAAPSLTLFRNSASPADSDDIGLISWTANDSTGAEEEFFKIRINLDDVTAGTEDASANFMIKRSGTDRTNLRIRYSEVVVNESSTDCNFRVESNANAHMFLVDAGLDRVSVGAAAVSGGATFQVPDNTISHYCNVNTIRSDAVGVMTMVNEDCQGQMWVHDSASAHEIDLPEGGVKGMHFQFMSTDGNITIDPLGSDTLNGGTASLTRSTNYEIYDVFCYDTGKWALSNPA